MSVDPSNSHVGEILERAGLLPAPSSQILAQLHAACFNVEGYTDAVLDVSLALWATETQEEDVLVVLMRKLVVLVAMRKRGIFKAPEPDPRTAFFADYQDVGDDDDFAGHTVWFLTQDEDRQFLLKWADARERDRMFRAIFDAHAGRYERWGLQLNPVDYVADFDRYYAQLVAEGPTHADGWHGWVEERFGAFYYSNALGCASEWRYAELADATGREGPPQRVIHIGNSRVWTESNPEARHIIVRLAGKLFDEGRLSAPYDEYTFDSDEPLRPIDAGPARLIALMTLAAHAKTLDHPRAAEWGDAASLGIPAVPPTVFPESLRTLWAEIGELPAVEATADAEIPIWDDVDVRAISTLQGDPPRPVYSTGELTEADSALVAGFFDADRVLKADVTPDGEALANVCLLGVAAFEGMSAGAPPGWRKLILYAVSDLTYDLWEKHKLGDTAAKLAHWVLATIEGNHWGPDGRSTPLGQHHSYAMGVAVATGVGVIQIDPDTGLASAPTGDAARNAAAAGHF